MQPLLRSLTLGAFLVVVGAVISLSSQPTDAAFGTWTLNAVTSRYDPGPAPKTQALTYEAAGQGVRVTAKTVDARGQTATIEYTASYDGQDYATSGGAGL